MTIQLSCADYTWPSVSHPVALDLIAALGFDGVDIGLLAGRSHVRPEQIEADVPWWAGRIRERCDARGLAVADVFGQSADFWSLAVNHPDPAERERSLHAFGDWLDFARRLGSPGLTILPGVVFGDEPRDDAVKRAAEGLRKRADLAAAQGLRLSVEPHTGSIIDTPARTAELLELTPGLMLTLDYGHFVFAGEREENIEPLLPSARHIQCRGGAPGVLQAAMSASVIDHGRIVRSLKAQGYAGFLACEYVWADWHRCNEVDNLTETVELRRVLSTELATE